MNLVIRANTLNDQPISQAIVGCFDLNGGTIGRSDTNTLTLPDPERRISRLQAEVHGEASGFRLRNVGTATPIFINGRAIAPGENGVLGSGDELRIGGYALGVLIEAESSATRTILDGRAFVDARAVIVGSVVEARKNPPAGGQLRRFPGATPAADNNPFADLLGLAAATPAIDDPFAFLAAPMPAQAKAQTPAPSAPAPLPADFDPFAALDAPLPPVAPAARGPKGAADLLGLVGAGAAASGSLEASFGLGEAHSASGADPLVAFMGTTPSKNPLGPLVATPSTDPLAMFGSPAAVRDNEPAVFDHTPELQGAYQPPRIASTPAAPFVPASLRSVEPPAVVRAAPQPVPAAAPLAKADAPDALWAAFCEGSGVSVPLPGALDADQMRMLGMILREAVDGAVRLMAVRTLTKSELRAPITVIRPRNNNPLKFSPDFEVALAQILQPPVRGFMPGPMAMQDAMHDLLGHTIGTMAGMRAALAGVLARFEPAQLEAKLAGKSMLDSLVPGARKAKLWDLYVQHFESIHGEARDDFHTLFGNAFVAAYEEQLAQMQPRRG